MKSHLYRWSSLLHHWGSIICLVPVTIILITGILLLLKKDVDWIQPPSVSGDGGTPAVSYEVIMAVVTTVPEAEVAGWEDIYRLDYRPGKGLIKVRAKNGWEIQLDHQTGELRQVAYRWTDLIESLHDGTFFHDRVKLGLFLPASLVLLMLVITGTYMFTRIEKSKSKKRRRISRHGQETDMSGR